MLVDINKITVSNRERKLFRGIEQLAESIRLNGQVQPIVVDENYELIAGERRLRACQHLNLPQVEVVIREGLTPRQKKIMELEENIQREDMTWQEVASAYYHIHELFLAENPNTSGERKLPWSPKNTAEVLKVSYVTVYAYLSLYHAIADGIREVIECKTFRSAEDALRRYKETVVRKEIGRRQLNTVANNDLLKLFDTPTENLGEELEEEELEEEIEEEIEKGIEDVSKDEFEEEDVSDDLPTIFRLGDCSILLKDIPKESVHLIITDPIWGVDIEFQGKFDNDAVHFVDSSHLLERLIPLLCPEFFRVLKPDAHLYLFTPIKMFPLWQNCLVQAGFDVRETPLVWVKEGGGFTNMEMKFMPQWEPILFAAKGSLPLAFPSSDVFHSHRPPQEQRYVPTQKPLPLLRNLIRLSTVEGDIILDPFCGSGSGLIAAWMEKRVGIGIDENEDVLNIARFYLDEMKKKGRTNGTND